MTGEDEKGETPGLEPTLPATPDELAPTTPGDGASAGSAPGLAPGARIGRYVLGRLLGAGGMGVVYRARDPELKRELAIKLVRPGVGAAAQARVLREAEAMAKLRHPGVVTVFDVGTHDGQVFLAMPLLEGGTLGRWMSAEPRPWRAVVVKFLAAARGLAAAHAVGLVHRDFKPDNVLLGAGDEVQVADFGLARVDTSSPAPAEVTSGDRTSATPALTQTGALMGTPAYMAPEQLDGETVDERADQFSFCVALHEALYGRRPFETTAADAGGLAALREAIRGGRLPTAPADRTAPRWLRALVVRGLSETPDARWPSMAALIAELERRLRRPRWLLLATGVAALAAAGLLVAMLQRGEPAARRPACATGAARLAGVWDAEKRRAVITRYDATDKAYIRATGTAVVGQLDEYARVWATTQDTYCREDAARDELQHAKRRDCVDDRLFELRVMVRWVEHADPEAVARSHEAAWSGGIDVPVAAECLDERIVGAHIALLRDEEARSRETDATFRLALSTFEGDAPEMEAAIQELEALGSGYLARALLDQASYLRTQAGETGRADAMVDRAIDLADRTRDDVGLASALINRAFSHVNAVLETGGAYQSAAVEALLERASVAVERAGRPTRSVLKYLSAKSWHALQLEREEEALALAEEAVGVSESGYGAGSLQVAEARAIWVERLIKTRDYEAALREVERVDAIVVAVLGPDHPRLASAQRLRVLIGMEHTQEAVDENRRDDTILVAAYGPDSARVAQNRGWLAALTFRVGRVDESIQIRRTSIESYERQRAAGADVRFFNLGSATANLGIALVERGRLVDGIATLREAEELLLAAVGPEHIDAIYGVGSPLQHALIDTGQIEEARRRSKEIYAKLAGTTYPTATVAQLRLELAPWTALLDALAGKSSAEPAAREALAACEAVASARCDLADAIIGRVLVVLGRDRDAATHLEPIVGELRTASDATPGDQTTKRLLLEAETELGRARLALGEIDGAVEVLEPVVAAVADWTGAAFVPDAQFALARALPATDADRAVTLAEAARDGYTALGKGKAPELRAVTRWLRAR